MTTTATVTILFTDVVGSVELRTKHGDESAHKLMETHFDLVRRQIEQHSGEEVKTMGDGFMVAFTSARQAVNCAVAVQKALADHNRNNPDEQVQVRIGLNTGEAIEKAGDLFGSAVDAASRIMSKAAGDQILVSETVRNVIGAAGDINLIDRGPFWLKGFPERWRLYEVLWQEEKVSVASAPPRIVERTPFVGRENERADLRRHLEQAKGGHGSLVMIGGEPGVGKTRITEELVAEARRHGFLTLTGHCYEIEGAPPYIPFLEIIETASRIIEPQALLTTMGASAPEVAKLVPELRRLFPDIPEFPQMQPEQERWRMFNGFRDFIARAAHAQPLLLVIEDLHWTDEPTLLLLQHIVQELHEIPALVVGTYRDTELDVARSLANALKELIRRRLANDLLLKPLPKTDISAMLQGRSGRQPPARLVEVIYEETEGNPFFVEEVFKHLAEEGKLFDADGQWRTDLRIDELDVPRSVLLVIGHRLERVTQECKRTLTTAAVIGHAFGFQLLEKLIDLGDDAVFDAVDEAERAQLIRSTTRGGEARLKFSHELIRQTLLSDLSTPRRQRLHLRVAEATELLYANVLQQYAADLAYHFYQGGGNAGKIIEYAVLAAQRATVQTAYEEAVAQYKRAIETLERPQPIDELRQCDLLLALGRAYGHAGDPDHAKETLMRVTEIARKLPAPKHFGEAVLGLYQFLWIAGAIDDQLLSLMDEALALLPAEDNAIRASITGCLSKALALVDDKRCAALSEQAIAMARRIDDPGALCHALNARVWVWDRPLTDRISDAIEFAELEEKTGFFDVGGNEGKELLYYLHCEQGDIAASDADLTALKEQAAETANPGSIYRIREIEADRALMMGRFEVAERLAMEAFALGQKVNELNALQGLQVRMYHLWWLQGRLAEAGDAERSQNPQLEKNIIYRAPRAHILLMLGRKERARVGFERIAANDFTDLPRHLMMPFVLLSLSEVAAALGDTHRAAQLYDLLLPCHDRLLVSGFGTPCSGAASHWLGILASTMKRWHDAAAHFENAIETNARIGARPYLARSQHEYARLLIERDESGDKEKAKSLLSEATATYRELGMPTFLENAEELMQDL